MNDYEVSVQPEYGCSLDLGLLQKCLVQRLLLGKVLERNFEEA